MKTATIQIKNDTTMKHGGAHCPSTWEAEAGAPPGQPRLLTSKGPACSAAPCDGTTNADANGFPTEQLLLLDYSGEGGRLHSLLGIHGDPNMEAENVETRRHGTPFNCNFSVA